jgi:hypothetical protein
MPILLVMLMDALSMRRGSAQGEVEVAVEVEKATVAADIDINDVGAGNGTGGGACLDTGDIPKSATDRVPRIGTGTCTGCCFSLDRAFPLRAGGALRDLSWVGGSGSGRGGAFSGAGAMCFEVVLGVCEGVGWDVN